MIYVTADWHLGHANIIKYTNRPFDDVWQMDSILLENAMNTLKPTDHLYILGDFASNNKAHVAYTNALKALCTVTHIRGNHDAKQVGGSLAESFKYNSKHYYLCHFPWATWTPNTVMLHGHCHGQQIPLPTDSRQQWRYDVGVDVEWGRRKFYPVSIDLIEEAMMKGHK
jgi:calcineurin-like phosphoesterase family protein